MIADHTDSAPRLRAGGVSVGDPRAAAEGLRRGARILDRCLWAVAALVAYFSAGNVTAFATEHGTPLHIAVVLAPMVDVALVAALVADGVLSRWGVRPGAWGTLLRWFAGVATLTLNVWESVARRDAAGIVLHTVPPLLLILLAEAAPAYRLRFVELADKLTELAAPAHARVSTPQGGAMLTSAGPGEAQGEVSPVVPGEVTRDRPGEVTRDRPGEVTRDRPGEVTRDRPGELPRRPARERSGEVPRKITRPRQGSKSARPASKPWGEALSESRELVARYRAEGRPVDANTIKTHVAGVGTKRAAELWDAVKYERPVHLVGKAAGDG